MSPCLAAAHPYGHVGPHAHSSVLSLPPLALPRLTVQLCVLGQGPGAGGGSGQAAAGISDGIQGLKALAQTLPTGSQRARLLE